MLSCLPHLFPIVSQGAPLHHTFLSQEKLRSNPQRVTSAPLLTQPSLTDYLSNFPFSHDKPKSSTAPSSRSSSPSVAVPSAESPPPTAPSFKKGEGEASEEKSSAKAQDRTTSKARKPKTDTQVGSQNRYQLRHKRQPKYKCGTCGSA